MKKKIILIDMDGVICDYAQQMLDLAHEKFDLPQYKSSEVSHFYTERIFSEDNWSRVEKLSKEKDFFLNLEPVTGAIEAIKEMTGDESLDVWICSSPKRESPFCHSEKFVWLQKHFGEDLANKLILIRDKTLVHGDYLIDDNLEIKGEKTPSWKHILFDQPYNKDADKKRLKDWSGWREIIK